MRVTSLMNKLLNLPGLWVLGVAFETNQLILRIRPRFRLLTCPRCGTQSRGRFEQKQRRWRHLALGGLEVVLVGPIRRLRCPKCKRVVTEAVPWARHGSIFTRPFEDLVAFLAQRLPKSAVLEMAGISWATVGTIVQRVVDEQMDAGRFDGLRRIGVDEISYRRHHKYLTVVVNHDTGKVIWAAPGKSAETLQSFFEQLTPEQLEGIEVVSMDLSAAYQKAVRETLPEAELVFDKFHIAQLAQRALDEVRRTLVRELPREKRPALKSSRWVLLKRPDRLSEQEADRLSAIKQDNDPLYRAYLLKESLLETLDAPGPEAANQEMGAWLSWASRCRLQPFVRLGKTVRKHRDGILRAISSGLTNARLEGLNNKIRLLSHRAFGFHSADSLIATIYLCCTGIKIEAQRIG